MTSDSSFGSELEEQLAKLRRSYGEKLPERLLEIETALKRARSQGGMDALRDAFTVLHRVRGTSGTYGYGKVSAPLLIAERELEKGLQSSPDRVDWALVDDAVARAAEELAAPAMPPLDVEYQNLIPPAILVADNDPEFLAQAVALGRKHVVRVATAQTLTEALALAAKTPMDGALIDIDLGLPQGGFALAKELRQLERGAIDAISFMSNNAGIENRVAAAHAGGSLFLLKPVKETDFVAATRQIASQRSVDLPHVLIVDDDPEFATLLSLYLQDARVQPVVLTDARRILEALEQVRPELLLLDVVMPGVSGFDLCRMLRSNPVWQGLTILLLTAYSSTEARLECFQAGGDDFIEKPVVKEELLARVKGRLERARLFRERAERDALTGLFTRRVFSESMGALLSKARRKGRTISLVLIDIDHFKEINDRYGHLAGDDVLAGLGRLLASRFRNEDVRGRWGGEEFILAFDDVDAPTTAEILARVQEEFRRMEFKGDHGESFQVTFSGGVSAYPKDGESLETLIQCADQRLYCAKRGGRNCLVSE